MTNGISDNALTALQRIGWKQPTQRGYDLVSDANTQSSSGRYFNDDSYHPALTVENIYDCQPDAELDEEGFNTYLAQLVKSNNTALMNAVFDAPVHLQSGLAFSTMQGVGLNALANSNRFCGLRIGLAQGAYALNLANAMVLMDSDVTFYLYLYHSLYNGAATKYIQRWQVTAKAGQMVNVPLNYDLSNSSYKDGEWFLGYFQQELGSAKAIDYAPVKNCYSHFGIDSMESTVKGSDDFDRIAYGSSAGSYGLNVEVASYCDRSQSVINSAHLFDNLQGLMMAARVINLIRNSTRANEKKRISRENIMQWLQDLKGIRDADTGRLVLTGIEQDINSEVKKLRAAFNSTQKSITYTNPIL